MANMFENKASCALFLLGSFGMLLIGRIDEAVF